MAIRHPRQSFLHGARLVASATGYYQFKNPGLLKQAMTHRSTDSEWNNQRLEFLGDRVLGLVVAEMLYAAFPAGDEGELARRQAALVCRDTLVEVARHVGLNEMLILSGSEEIAEGRATPSNLEDACEAWLGAVYLDGGLDAVRGLIVTLWQPLMDNTIEPPKDAKTSLQEWLQGRGHKLPAYKEVARSGPAHAPEFTIEVEALGHRFAASGNSKRAAEQAAAAGLLAILEN